MATQTTIAFLSYVSCLWNNLSHANKLKIDAEIENQFGDLIHKARASQLTPWTEKPQSTLALIILLDQFSRNIFRGTPESFSSDDLALNITTEAIAKGFDREVDQEQQLFFYMPFMHSETLLGQVAGVAHFELLQNRCDLGSDLAKAMGMSTLFARKHQHCIINFGRFPSRNKILGRESTAEEIEYLKEHPGGF